jgi:hypothetical protein
MVYTNGIPKLVKVNDYIYRSGQISSEEGWLYLNKIANGRKVHIIKLNFGNEGSDEIGEDYGFDVHRLPIQPRGDQNIWNDLEDIFLGPDIQTIIAAENLLMLADHKDIWLVHCTHGQDRTGLVIGIYRVWHDHWSKDAAYKEMIKNHFHPELYGLHKAWNQMITSIKYY